MFDEMKFWPLDFCIEVLTAELSNYHEIEYKTLMENWLTHLTFYEKVICLLVLHVF